MTPLREAFCAMMAHYPGPDASQYCAWARSEDQRDAMRLAYYARSSAQNIRRMDRLYPGQYRQDVAWLPLLDALNRELTTGEQPTREDVGAMLANAEAAFRSAA